MSNEQKKGKPLYKNGNGRYALDQWTELTCGCHVELKIGDEWVKVRIEHDGDDYYAVGLRGFCLVGILARIPEKEERW